MSGRKKIMVICNVFPPSPGIGGRRWAKFSKYLAQKDFEIHVAFPENLSTEVSTWNQDVHDVPSIKRHPLHFKYRSLFLNPRGTFGKLRRKARSLQLSSTRFSERFLTSLPNEDTWEKIASLVRQENIGVVFVSGDPFLFYYACQMKRSTGCRVILDYRDLWNDHSYYKNFYALSPMQWKFFQEAENTALRESDAVITVDDHLKEVIGKRVPGIQSKIQVIHNGFDPDDFAEAHQTSAKNDKRVLYFAGNIASDLSPIVLTFCAQFKELKHHRPHLYNSLEIHFKGRMDADLFARLRSFELENLKLSNEFVPLVQYAKEVANAEMGIVVLGKEYANSFTTKFSDYLCLDKKILVLGCPGKFSEFVIANRYGYHFDPEKSSWNFFETLMLDPKTAADYDAKTKKQFNIRDLTNELISVYEKYSTPASLAGH